METTQTLTWQVSGMHCSSCSILIDEAVEDLAGVTTSSTSLKKKRTTVSFNPEHCTADQIAAAITEAGYQATPTPDEAPSQPRSWFRRAGA